MSVGDLLLVAVLLSLMGLVLQAVLDWALWLLVAAPAAYAGFVAGWLVTAAGADAILVLGASFVAFAATRAVTLWIAARAAFLLGLAGPEGNCS